MKKVLLLALVVFSCCLLPLASQEADEDPLTYINFKVYKVLEHKEAYIVTYGTFTNKVASVIIPKTWIDKHPRKLLFRKLQKPLEPFMTVFYRGGEFYRMFLTMPTDRRESVWGTAPFADVSSELGKETLSLEF
jgi:hypothetical protein